MDTFYGQFKSTCVCPRCGEISVSFEVFNQVSLEIPQPREKKRVVPVLLFRDGSSSSSSGSSGKEETTVVPSWYGIPVARNGRLGDIKRTLALSCGVPPDRLLLCDLYEHGVYDFLTDERPASKLMPDDMVGAYEMAPYGREVLHTIVMHSEMVADPAMNGGVGFKMFGYPVLMSFPMDSTCGEIWDRVWGRVSHLVVHDADEEEKEEEGGKDGKRPFMQIRIVADGRGQPCPIFKGGDEDDDDTSSLSRIQPKTSDVPRSQLLRILPLPQNRIAPSLPHLPSPILRRTVPPPLLLLRRRRSILPPLTHRRRPPPIVPRRRHHPRPLLRKLRAARTPGRRQQVVLLRLQTTR